MGKSKVILPKKLVSNPAGMARAITNAMNGAARDIQIDFRVTTQTWNGKPDFTIQVISQFERAIGTGHAVYKMLNEGTRAHLIYPRRSRVLVFNTPFVSKTLPRSISSRGGRKGSNQVITRGPVRHPGTQSRQWDKVIKEKWDRLFPGIMQRAIDAEVR